MGGGGGGGGGGAILDSPRPSFFLLFCHSVIIQFLLNILKTNRPIETKFGIHIIIDKIYIGIVNRHFSQICNRVTALD